VKSRGRQAERLNNRGFGSQALVVTLMFLIALGGIGWVYMGMITRDRWPIRWLEVDGVFDHVSAEQVRTRLAPMVKGSFFTVDLEAVNAVTRQIAWISQVSVQKEWPDTVRVSVYEHVPLAHWVDGNLMSEGASIFRVPGADGMQGLPWLEGPPGFEEQVFEAWRSFNAELTQAGLEIERIRLDRRGAWYLELTNGTQVQLGRENAIDRLHRLVASWPALVNQDERLPAGIDLRYTNGFAVRWAEPLQDMGTNPG
jgi:cell division protein FtsQ